MKRFFRALRGRTDEDDETLENIEEEYVELNNLQSHKSNDDGKIIIRSFAIEDFSDVKVILDSLRDGNTICMINIKPLKDKDIVELKRAISKIKKTCDAIKGDVAGIGDDYIIVTPSFAEIYRSKNTKPAEQVQARHQDFDTY